MAYLLLLITIGFIFSEKFRVCLITMSIVALNLLPMIISFGSLFLILKVIQS